MPVEFTTIDKVPQVKLKCPRKNSVRARRGLSDYSIHLHRTIPKSHLRHVEFFAYCAWARPHPLVHRPAGHVCRNICCQTDTFPRPAMNENRKGLRDKHTLQTDLIKVLAILFAERVFKVGDEFLLFLLCLDPKGTGTDII